MNREGFDLAALSERAAAYLEILCGEITERRVGSAGNRAATEFFARTIAAFGFQVETPQFDCMDWSQAGADLTANGVRFEAFVSPYSLGGRACAPLAAVSTVEELAATEVTDQVLLLHGGIAAEPLMPKNFTFWNPEEHQRIIRLLEEKKPAAIVCATARHPEMAGAVYPFPLIEDGDFDIPSVYMTDEEGRRLAALAGNEAVLEIRAQRRPATGCNVIARKEASTARRIVICAHIDAKDGTPGALDNAAGTITLLLLAELLAGYAGALGVEIVAFNGEDYYSSPGEMQYLAQNAGRLDEIVLAANLDGLGYREGRTAFSLYECPPDLGATICQIFKDRPDMVEGEPWYQGDHTMFVMNGRPALAFTSEKAGELVAQYVHTPKDAPALVDPERLAGAAVALRDLVLGMHDGGEPAQRSAFFEN